MSFERKRLPAMIFPISRYVCGQWHCVAVEGLVDAKSAGNCSGIRIRAEGEWATTHRYPALFDGQ
jgi:hypothetical protein